MTDTIEAKPVGEPVAWWMRLLHFVVDGALLWWLSAQVSTYFITQMAYTRDFFWLQALFPVLFLVAFTYFFVSEYWFGKTLGKSLTKATVVTTSGQKPSASQIAIRSLMRLVLLDVMTFLSRRPAGWHDVLSKTRVVQSRRVRYPLAETYWSGWKRYVNYSLVGFVSMVTLFLLISPVIVFHNWSEPRQLSESDYSWANYNLGQAELWLPVEPRGSSRPRADWEARVARFQPIIISVLPNDSEPSYLVRQTLREFQLNPLMLIRLADFEWAIEGQALWYSFTIEQTPLFGSGYLIRSAADGDWHHVRHIGFKLDSTELMRASFDYWLTEQSNEL